MSQVRPYFFDQPSDAAAEGQPGDAGLGHDAGRNRHPVDVGFAIEIAEQDARLDADASGPRVHVDALHAREVDDQPAVAERAAADVVSASADRDEEVVVAREVDRRDDVRQSGTARDQPRALVDAGVPDPARDIVIGVGGPDDRATARRPELRDRFVGDRSAGVVDQYDCGHDCPPIE